MIRSVCVFSASSQQVASAYVEEAEALGLLLANHHIRLINGAGRVGLMGACADACLKAGGEVVGVIPRFMIDEGWQHDELTELIVTDTMGERKKEMAKRSDAIMALPGGCGTMEELLELITLKQLGIYLHPIIIVNVDGYFDPLLAMLQRAIDEHFMRPLHREMWQVAHSAKEAVDMLSSIAEWEPSLRKQAAL